MKTQFRHFKFLVVKSILAAALIGSVGSAGSTVSTAAIRLESCKVSQQHPNQCTTVNFFTIKKGEIGRFPVFCPKTTPDKIPGYVTFLLSSGTVFSRPMIITPQEIQYFSLSPVENDVAVRVNVNCVAPNARAAATLFVN